MRGIIKMAVAATLVGLALGSAGCVFERVEWSFSGVAHWGGTDAPAAGVTVSLGGQCTLTQVDGSFMLSGKTASNKLQVTLTIGGDMAVTITKPVTLGTDVAPAEIVVLRKIYYVDPGGSDDNDGSKLHPMKTIHGALLKPELKRLQLAAGNYVESETLCMVDDCELMGNVNDPESCVLSISSADQPLISGSMTDYRVCGVKLVFPYGVEYVAVRVATGEQAEFDHCVFDTTNGNAVLVESGSTLCMTDCVISGGMNGVWVRDNSSVRTTVTLERVTVQRTMRGICADWSIGVKYDLFVTGCTFSDNSWAIEFNGAGKGSTGTLSVSGSVFSNNGHCINITGGEVSVGGPAGGNTFAGNGFGMRIGGGHVDLGGPAAGGNTFAGNAEYGLCDARLENSGELNAVGNTWSTALTGTVSGPADAPPDYAIYNAGNSIVFSQP